MRVFYQSGRFISHQRAGRDNMAALELAGVEVVADPDRADVLVVHDEPPFLAAHLAALGGPDKPRVAYSVFEMDRAPAGWRDMLARFDEVWTCTEFSRHALAGAHDRIRVVPHVARRPGFSPQELESVRELLGMEPGPGQARPEYWFYTVCDGRNQRKNLPALVRAFGALKSLGLHIRLAVKQYRDPLPGLDALPGVRALDQDLTEGQVAALHALCHCYVSPHRAEAWGLSLSEAMAFGNPVVATAHSGNTEYMDETNSLPVAFALRAVTEEEAAASPGKILEPGMVWAEPDEEDLVRRMRCALEGGYDPELPGRARLVAREYGLEPVGRLMRGLLHSLVKETAGEQGA